MPFVGCSVTGCSGPCAPANPQIHYNLGVAFLNRKDAMPLARSAAATTLPSLALFGASGTLGRRIAQEALDRGHTVTAPTNAQQTAAPQSVTAWQAATAAAQPTARAAAQQSAQAAAQQPVVAGQTATVVARQDEVGVRATAQETAVAAQAQDTAVAQQTADAAVQQTVVAQETAVAASQQVATAQAVAQARAQAPHDIPLGFWAHQCVVQSTSTDETITYTSDDTWAEGTCASVLARADSPYVPFPTNNARPGYTRCAFIHLYGSGLWREFSNYANPPSGDAQIAVRSTYWGDAAADCASIANWTAQQSAAN